MSEITDATTEAPKSKHARIAEQVIGGIVTASNPDVSPDGRQIAFVVNRVDFAKNRSRAQIWVAAADGSTPPRPLSSGDKSDTQPRWSPDGRSLAFASSRSENKGESTLHVIPMDGPGEVRTIATMKDGIASVSWSPDGAWLAFTSRTKDVRYDAEDESWQSPRKIERFFTRLNGEGWVFDRPAHVYVIPSNGMAAPRNLTPGPFQHEGTAWLADSSAVVTSAARHETWDTDLATDLYLVPLGAGDVDGGGDGEPTALTHQTGIYFSPSVSPDGTRVAFLGADDPLIDPQNQHVGVLSIAAGEVHWASRGLDRTFASTAGVAKPVWLDNETLLAHADDRGRGHVYRVSADGSTSPVAVTEGQRWVRAFDSKAGTLAITVSSVDRPSELAVVIGGVETQLTHLSDSYVATTNPLPWEHFTVPTTDGTLEIDAWIMRPDGFDETTKYPVIINVHGGPHTQYGETFFDEAQFQAKSGFVVLMSNPRGGSGREESWGQSILGPKHPVRPGTGWGSVDVDDVLAVLDTALERYDFCDPDRVGMQGGSYGGYMATMLAGLHGERFKGICSERAVNNMISEEWSSDIGSVFRVEHGPSHIDDPDEYIRMSPIRHVRDIHVPILIVHSENDLRCPISQAEELFMALRLLGRDVTFYRFPGETHELSRSGSPVHRRQRAEIILDWFSEKLAAETSLSVSGPRGAL
jgi:dipeptidyl aminopeptidase/acylaminoacyl peptidase